MSFFSSFFQGAGFGASSTAARNLMEAATGSAADAATGAAASAAAPLFQQGVSALNSRNDESVILALLSQLKDDHGGGLTRKQKLEKWQALNDGLSSHQRSELRKIIVNLKLPERFEKFESEKTDATKARDGSQTRGATRRFQRLPKDYEFTPDDYRLAVIEMLLEMETNEAVQCVASMVSELSLVEKAKKEADQLAEATFRLSAALLLGPGYRDSMNKGDVIKALTLRKAERAVERAKARQQRRPFSKKGWTYIFLGAGASLLLILLSLAS